MTSLSTSYQCPVDPCLVKVSQSKFMCPRHWGMVPDALKQAVNEAWRKYQNDPRAHARELRLAQQEALESIQ
jgi:hypothetical protein